MELFTNMSSLTGRDANFTNMSSLTGRDYLRIMRMNHIVIWIGLSLLVGIVKKLADNGSTAVYIAFRTDREQFPKTYGWE